MSQYWTDFSTAETAMDAPLPFEQVLEMLSPRDRLNVEKHIMICETHSLQEHATLWQRLIGMLMTLAPDHVKSFGRHALQFYIPDGKYRMQVFALHDADGQISLYADDVRQRAIDRGMLHGPVAQNMYRLAEDEKELLIIEAVEGRSTSPQPFYKEMLGWNRHAMRISIPIGVSDAQMHVIGKLCALAAATWHTV